MGEAGPPQDLLGPVLLQLPQPLDVLGLLLDEVDLRGVHGPVQVLEAPVDGLHVGVAAVAVAALDLTVAVPERLGDPLPESQEVVLAAETDRRDGLLDHGAVPQREQPAGHALRGVLLLHSGTRGAIRPAEEIAGETPDRTTN